VHLSRLFIERPVMTGLVMTCLVVFGVAAYRLLPVSDLPTVDLPTISVQAVQSSSNGSVSGCTAGHQCPGVGLWGP